MRFSRDEMSLRYGTDDAPAPATTVDQGKAIEIIAGVKPADASKNVELLYRINSRPIGKSIKATFLRGRMSSAREWRGTCTGMTLSPAFCRIGITLLHEDPSTYVPWTRTIFMFVAFVDLVMLVGPGDCISVLFCCCALTNPDCVTLKVRHTTN